MKKIQLLVFLLTAWVINAQVILKGVVNDSTGMPLEMANIIAINTSTKKIESYGFSDVKGSFKLNLKKNTMYSIRASYVGFKTSDVILETNDNDFVKNINLKKDDSLDEVNITYKMPVSIKGDTIIYNADSFRKGTEKKLGDVIENLPGVEINDNGEIEVEGKSVNKIMVEGKDFFDGDTKIATKNIPANAVDKIQVLKNYSEVSQLGRVIDNEDNIVINIKLKEGKKNFWFGELTAGMGVGMTNDRYIITPKLFYYNPTYSVNIITDMNDIGEVSFTNKDYFKFMGGFRRSNESNGTNFDVGSSDISFLTLKNNKAKQIESKFGAVNFNYSPKKIWNLSGFLMYSGNKTDMEETTSHVYSNLGIDKSKLASYKANSLSVVNHIDSEETQDKTHQVSDLGMFKLSSSYKPNVNNQFDYDFFAKISKQKQLQNTLSSRTYLNAVDEIVPVYQISEQSSFSINQSLKYYLTLNEKNIFVFEAQHLWQEENPFYNAVLEKLSFANLIGADITANSFNIGQNKKLKTNKFDATLDYYYVVSPESNFNITLGATQSKQQFNSDIFEILEGNKSVISQSKSINNVDFIFSDVYFGLHYKFITEVFTFNQGFTFHNYMSKNTQLGSEAKNRVTKILPNVSIKMSFKKSETLRLSYSMETSFTNVNQLAEGYVFNNYNSLYSGNRNLENSIYHNVSLSYFNFNMFNYTDIFGIVNYSKSIDEVKSSTDLIDVNSLTTVVNSGFPDEIISAKANFQKSLKKFKVRVGANVSYSISNSLISSSQTNVVSNRLTKTFSQIYTSRVSSNFQKTPNFDMGYNLSVNNSNIGGVKNSFITHSPYFDLDIPFFKEFVFTSKYTYNKVFNEGELIDEYGFLIADVTYQKKNSKWEYKLSATNLLNSSGLNQNSSNDVYVSNSTYLIQPRIAMFTVKYNL